MGPATFLPAVILAAHSSGPGPDVTPVDSAATSVVAYWLSFGAIAVVAFVLFYLYVWPGKLTRNAREDARADLLKENDRLRAELTTERASNAELQEFVRNQLVPAVTSFTAVATSLIPLLQASISSRGSESGRGSRGPR